MQVLNTRPMHRLNAFFFGGVAAAALGACTVGPNYQQPQLNIESSYAPAEAQSVPTAWWTALHDPTLDGLLATAASSNLDLQQAEARIREARAQRAVIQGTDQPNLNADAGYDRQRYSQNAAPFNAFNIPGFPWEFNLYQMGFDASWEIDIFGGNRRALEAASANVQAQQEDRRSVLVTLLGEVGRNYVELRGYQQEQVFAQHNLDVQEQSLSLTRDREKNGVGNDLDVSRAQAQVADTAARIPVYEREEWQAIHRLCVLTNQPLDQLLYLRQAGPIPVAPDAVSAGIPAELLRRRPDIRAAERRLAAATARIGQAQAELYPKLSLTGFFDLQSASIDDLWAWRSRAFSIGPAVTWPIFEAGRLRAAVRVATSQQEQAFIAYQQSVQGAIAEVRDDLITFSTERSRRASLAQAAAADQEALDLSNQLYSQGLVDFLSVLDAQRQLYTAQDQLAQSDAQLAATLIALYKALGGGWETLPHAPATAPATEPKSPDLPHAASDRKSPDLPPPASAATQESMP